MFQVYRTTINLYILKKYTKCVYISNPSQLDFTLDSTLSYIFPFFPHYVLVTFTVIVQYFIRMSKLFIDINNEWPNVIMPSFVFLPVWQIIKKMLPMSYVHISIIHNSLVILAEVPDDLSDLKVSVTFFYRSCFAHMVTNWIQIGLSNSSNKIFFTINIFRRC